MEINKNRFHATELKLQIDKLFLKLDFQYIFYLDIILFNDISCLLFIRKERDITLLNWVLYLRQASHSKVIVIVLGYFIFQKLCRLFS